MPFGDIFSRFEEIDLTTADEIDIKFRNNEISRIGFRILGMPHIGMRLRARNIMRNVPRNKGNMLDAGFGSGIYSFSLSEKVKRIEAVDISRKKVEIANKIKIFKNINFQQGDLTELRFKDSSFDFIVCSDVLEHIKNDEKAFSELARVLKKNGILLLTVPSYSRKNRLSYRDYEHERAGYSMEDIKKLCLKNNLSTIKIEGYSCFLTEALSRINYKIINNKFLLGILFYPLYLAVIVSDYIFKDYNGFFFSIKKN